jgi:sugar-specific transcriptional regulator TrmB
MPLSRTEARVIDYLYSQSQGSKYAAEIARELKIKKRTIYDTLESLMSKGIVEEQLRGQMKFYKLTDKWKDVAEAAKTMIAETNEALPTLTSKTSLGRERIILELDRLLPIAERTFDSPSVEKLKDTLQSMKKESKEGVNRQNKANMKSKKTDCREIRNGHY